MGEPALRTHCSSPPVSTMNKTACSARSLLRTASTATKSSVYGILFFRKAKHVERNKTAESGHALPSFLFSTSKQESLLSAVHFSVLFCLRCFFPCISPLGRVMLRFPALLAALHSDQRKKLLDRDGDHAAVAIGARCARQHRCRCCRRGILRTFRCANARETRRKSCRVRSGNFRLGRQLAERRHGPQRHEAPCAYAHQTLRRGSRAQNVRRLARFHQLRRADRPRGKHRL